MKKLVICLSIIFLSISLFASVGGGYSFSPMGETFGGESIGGVEIGGYFSPFGIKNYGKIEVDVVLGTKPFFKGLNFSLSTPIYQTSKHLFNRIFSNPILWQPTISVGAQFRMKDNWRFMFQLSPFSFQDTSFSYNIISPYLIVDMNGKLGWGMTIFKISATFGGVE